MNRETSRSLSDSDSVDRLYTPEPNTGCWLFLGSVSDVTGYGSIHRKGYSRVAHVAVYQMLVGEVPVGLELDHTCRQRSCINPKHLRPVTHRDNQRRNLGFAGINARKTHCLRGHEFTPENTYTHGNGNRNCRACVVARRQEAA